VMRAFLTGASSDIGGRVVRALLLEGYEVICLSRKKGFEIKGATVIQGDLQDPPGFKGYLEDIDLIIHGAAVTHTDDHEHYLKINFEATKDLIFLAECFGIKRFVFLSTRAIGPGGGAYASSKYLAEEALKTSRLDWVILRIAEVYGTTKKEGINSLINQVLKRKIIPVIGNGKYELAPVYADDVKEAILSVIKHRHIKKKTYTICGPETFSLNEMISVLCRFYSLERIRVHVPISLIRMAVHIKRLLPLPFNITEDQIPRLQISKDSDFSAAERDLGFSPVKFESWLPITASIESSGKKIPD
jgi:nucleoside-diphosphate-sugar epimerase